MKAVVLNDSPKRRSRTVVRRVMLAAWAKQSLFNDTPKCRSRTVVRRVMLAAWAKQSLFNDTPKCRSRGKREKRKALCSTTLQSVGVGCPKWRVMLCHNRDLKMGNPPRMVSRMRLLAVQNADGCPVYSAGAGVSRLSKMSKIEKS
ncbi:MAG: hypothetical protein WC721_21890 [Victivallaceae bacterium]